MKNKEAKNLYIFPFFKFYLTNSPQKKYNSKNINLNCNNSNFIKYCFGKKQGEDFNI